MLTSISGAILSGGRNSRMHGQNKGCLHLGKETFLQRLYQTLSAVCADVRVITRNPEDSCAGSFPVDTDIFSLRSSLTGIHAALHSSRRNYVFITACDSPLLVPGLIRLLMNRAVWGDEVVVPVVNGYFEPLCALYSKTCLPVAERLLQSGLAKISTMYSQVRIRTVSEAEVLTVDPGLDSFINVNTPEDLAALLQRTGHGRP
jgi:molybdopterin-guanine dinucleotide biosynthesis protein A